jgi:hypothetical protein
MIIGAALGMADIVLWCIEHTTVRPWVPGRALLCTNAACAESAWCVNLSHNAAGFLTTAVHAACAGGHLALARQLCVEYAECAAGVRDSSLRDEVRPA